MYIEIEDQRAIGQIVCTFARKPKTHIDYIRIYDSRQNDGTQIARIRYYDGRQRRYGEHLCCAELSLLKDTAYLSFYCCHTRKIARIKLEVTTDQPPVTKQ